jgi:hypothetical protein
MKDKGRGRCSPHGNQEARRKRKRRGWWGLNIPFKGTPQVI